MITVKNIFGDVVTKVSRDELISCFKASLLNQPIARVKRTVEIGDWIFRIPTLDILGALALLRNQDVQTIVVHESSGRLYII